MLFRLIGPNLNSWSVIFETTPKQSLKITSKVVRLALNRTIRVFVVYWPTQKCVISDKQRLRSTLLNWTQSCNPNLCMYTHTHRTSATHWTHTPLNYSKNYTRSSRSRGAAHWQLGPDSNGQVTLMQLASSQMLSFALCSVKVRDFRLG